MSSKSSKKNISFKAIYAVLGVALACLTPIRIYQLICLNERDSSGFFARINPSVYIFYALAVVFAVALFVLVTLSNKVTASKSVRGKSKSLLIGSALFALGLAYDTGICVGSFIKAVTSYGAGSNVMAYLFSNGMFALFFEAVFGLCACIYFILFALYYNDGKGNFSDYKFLALTPLFWAMFKTVYRFMTKISFTVLADLMLELGMLIFMMLFFMSFARISSQVCQKYEMRKAMRYGLIGAMFALVIGISRLAVTVCGLSSTLPTGFPFSLTDLTFGIFAIIYVAACSKSGRSASEDDLLADNDEKPSKDKVDEDFLNN